MWFIADDIVLLDTDIQELNTMLNGSNGETKQIGLKMNRSETKMMSNSEYNITIDKVSIEMWITIYIKI